MTAAHAAQPARDNEGSAPKHTPKHREIKTPRRLHVPSIRRNSDAKPATPTKAPRRSRTQSVTSRVTPTGQAMFSVDSAGTATPNLALRGANGFATVAVTAGEGLKSAYPGGFWVELFEDEKARSHRVNAQAIAQTLILVGSFAAKLASKKG